MSIIEGTSWLIIFIITGLQHCVIEIIMSQMTLAVKRFYVLRGLSIPGKWCSYFKYLVSTLSDWIKPMQNVGIHVCTALPGRPVDITVAQSEKLVCSHHSLNR